MGSITDAIGRIGNAMATGGQSLIDSQHFAEQEKLQNNQRIQELIKGYAAMGGDPNKIPAGMASSAGISPGEMSLYGEEAKMAGKSRQDTAAAIQGLVQSGQIDPAMGSIMTLASLNPMTDMSKLMEQMTKTAGGVAERKITAGGQIQAAETRGEYGLREKELQGKYNLAGREITAAATTKAASIHAGAEDRATAERDMASQRENQTKLAIAKLNATVKGATSKDKVEKAKAAVLKSAGKDFARLKTKAKSPEEAMTNLTSHNSDLLNAPNMSFNDVREGMAFYVPKVSTHHDYFVGESHEVGTTPTADKDGWTFGFTNALAAGITDPAEKQRFMDDMKAHPNEQDLVISSYINQGKINPTVAAALKQQIASMAAMAGMAQPGGDVAAVAASEDEPASEDEKADASYSSEDDSE